VICQRTALRQPQFVLHLQLARRMTSQSSAQMGDVIHNAFVFNLKNWLGGTMNSDSLLQSVQDLFAVLEQRQIDYVLVGALPCYTTWKGATHRISIC
jgi:hypothetical protein